MLPSGVSLAWRTACDVVALTSGRLGSFSYSDYRKISVKHKYAFVTFPLFESVRNFSVLSPHFTWARLTNSACSLLPLSAFVSLYSVLVNQTLVCSLLQACSQYQVLPLLSSLVGMPHDGLYILNTELKHHFLSRPFPTSWSTFSMPCLHAPVYFYTLWRQLPYIITLFQAVNPHKQSQCSFFNLCNPRTAHGAWSSRFYKPWLSEQLNIRQAWQ